MSSVTCRAALVSCASTLIEPTPISIAENAAISGDKSERHDRDGHEELDERDPSLAFVRAAQVRSNLHLEPAGERVDGCDEGHGDEPHHEADKDDHRRLEERREALEAVVQLLLIHVGCLDEVAVEVTGLLADAEHLNDRTG